MISSSDFTDLMNELDVQSIYFSNSEQNVSVYLIDVDKIYNDSPDTVFESDGNMLKISPNYIKSGYLDRNFLTLYLKGAKSFTVYSNVLLKFDNQSFVEMMKDEYNIDISF